MTVGLWLRPFTSRAVRRARLFVVLGGLALTAGCASSSRPADRQVRSSPVEQTRHDQLEAMSAEDAARVSEESSGRDPARRPTVQDRHGRQRVVDQPRVP